MRIVVNQKKLKTALSITERVTTRAGALPILSYVLLKTDGGRLKVLATNLEIGVSVTIGAKIDEVGEIAIPGRIFYDFVGGLSEDNVTLNTKSNTLTISSNDYKTTLLGSDTKEYPIIPRVTEGDTVTLPSKLLRSALLTTLDSTALSESRPELSGISVGFFSDKVVFASTDGFRLAEKTISSSNSKQQQVILPRNTASELIRILGEVDGEVVVRVGDNQIAFLVEDVEVVSRLIDGKYPDYAKLIPERSAGRALVDKAELERTIRLGGLFASSISDIRLKCSDDSIQISAKNSDKGEADVSTPCILKGEPFEVALNFRYLLDGLRVLGTEKVVIEFTGEGSPLIVKPGDDKKDTLYLVMPLRNT